MSYNQRLQIYYMHMALIQSTNNNFSPFINTFDQTRKNLSLIILNHANNNSTLSGFKESIFNSNAVYMKGSRTKFHNTHSYKHIGR